MCRCGAVSITEEEFTNLSLDLIPGGGTVEEMLRCYLKVRNASPQSFPLEVTDVMFKWDVENTFQAQHQSSIEDKACCFCAVLQETELDYNCECGATTSCQRLSFVNLPKWVTSHPSQMCSVMILVNPVVSKWSWGGVVKNRNRNVWFVFSPAVHISSFSL